MKPMIRSAQNLSRFATALLWSRMGDGEKKLQMYSVDWPPDQFCRPKRVVLSELTTAGLT